MVGDSPAKAGLKINGVTPFDNTSLDYCYTNDNGEVIGLLYKEKTEVSLHQYYDFNMGTYTVNIDEPLKGETLIYTMNLSLPSGSARDFGTITISDAPLSNYFSPYVANFDVWIMGGGGGGRANGYGSSAYGGGGGSMPATFS